MRPTEQTYGELQGAFEHFNRILFEGKLPACLITLQRDRKSYGYFAHSRFVSPEGNVTDEIALNPTYFAVSPIKEVLDTLVHEMVHLWQAHFGKPGRGRYHNRQWGDRMESLGLIPSSTGKPGGKKTGDHVSDYPVEGGPFDRAADLLLTENFRLSWGDRFSPAPTGGAPGVNLSNREKFKCPACGMQAWGKPSLMIRCGACDAGPFFELQIRTGHAASAQNGSPLPDPTELSATHATNP